MNVSTLVQGLNNIDWGYYIWSIFVIMMILIITTIINYLTDHIYFAEESPAATEICSSFHLLRISYDEQKN